MHKINTLTTDASKKLGSHYSATNLERNFVTRSNSHSYYRACRQRMEVASKIYMLCDTIATKTAYSMENTCDTEYYKKQKKAQIQKNQFRMRMRKYTLVSLLLGPERKYRDVTKVDYFNAYFDCVYMEKHDRIPVFRNKDIFSGDFSQHFSASCTTYRVCIDEGAHAHFQRDNPFNLHLIIVLFFVVVSAFGGQ